MLILYLMISLSLTLPSTSVDQRNQLESNTIENERFSNLIYDVTEIIQNDAGDAHVIGNDRLKSLNPILSPYLYYETKLLKYSDFSPNIIKCLDDEQQLLMKTTFQWGLIFWNNSTDLLKPRMPQQHTLPQNLESLSINFPDTEQECDIYCSRLIHAHSFVRCYSNYVVKRRGLEVNERLMNCIMDYCPDILIEFDILIMSVNVDPLTKILSLGLFKREINSLMENQGDFVKQAAPKCDFVLRITLSRVDSVSDKDKIKYRTYFSSFAQEWIKENKRAQIIMDTYASSMKDFVISRQGSAQEIPYLSFSKLRPPNYSIMCDLSKLIAVADSVYDYIILDRGDHNPYKPLTSNCNTTTYAHSLLRNASFLPHIIVKEPMEGNVSKFVENFQTHSLSLRINEIYIQRQATPKLIQIQLLENKGIHFGCHHVHGTNYFDDAHSILHALKMCKNILTREPMLLWEWKREVPFNGHGTLAHILERTLDVKEIFLEAYPNGKLTVQLHVFVSPLFVLQNLFCVPYWKLNGAFHEAIITWARIHEIGIILNPLVEVGTTTGLWYNIETIPSLVRSKSDFSVLVRRNFPKTLNDKNVLPFSYPCIQWTSELSNLSESEIDFQRNKFSGITLDLSILRSSPGSPQHIQTFLSYGFGRFTSVELTGISDSAQAVISALNKKFVDVIPGDKQLYIEMADGIPFTQDLKELSSSALRTIGLHISDWATYENNSDLQNLMATYLSRQGNVDKIQFGITIHDCIKETNNGLAGLKSLQYISYIRYIVCVVHPIPLEKQTNKYSMQLYLDTNFYLQQYFKAKLGVDTFFRLSFMPSSLLKLQSDTESYLKIMNDINQHSETYKIKYFMGNALSGSENGSWSWWRLANNKNLSDDSAYLELESAYFGRPTVRKFTFEQETFEDDSYLIIIIPVMIGLVIIVVGIFVLFARALKTNRVCLTQQEICNFVHGEERRPDDETPSKDCQDFSVNAITTRPFNSDFEIHKNQITLGDVIGKGNFGEVKKGVLHDGKDVAVKIPKSNCSEASFKTMLAEVKIQCYIGSHENIVLFIGAYTKEIEIGMIYIVTEFCKNGSLESYLRKLKQQSSIKEIVRNADAEGYRRGEEIPLKTFSAMKSDEMNELNRLAVEIATGMEYIASKNVIHSDLSTRNVLLDANITCKICDFGLSRRLYQSKKYIKKGMEGLPWRWMAPESLKRLHFTTKSDVWSFGVTLWEIYSLGDIPYIETRSTSKLLKQLQAGMRLPNPEYAPRNIYQEMLKCWRISEKTRPTFTELKIGFQDIITNSVRTHNLEASPTSSTVLCDLGC